MHTYPAGGRGLRRSECSVPMKPPRSGPRIAVHPKKQLLIFTRKAIIPLRLNFRMPRWSDSPDTPRVKSLNKKQTAGCHWHTGTSRHKLEVIENKEPLERKRENEVMLMRSTCNSDHETSRHAPIMPAPLLPPCWKSVESKKTT